MPRIGWPLLIACLALLPLALAMCAANNPAWRSVDLQPPPPTKVEPAESHYYVDEDD